MMKKNQSGGLSVWEWIERKKDILYLNQYYEKPDLKEGNADDILVLEIHPFALRIWTDYHLIHEEDTIFETIYTKRMKKKYPQIDTVLQRTQNGHNGLGLDESEWSVLDSRIEEINEED